MEQVEQVKKVVKDDFCTAPIKAEFVIEKQREVDLEHVSEADKRALEEDGESGHKSKKLKGQNKKRPPTVERAQPGQRLCHYMATGKPCPFSDCRFQHSIEEYLKIKPEDIGPECPTYKSFGFCSFGLSCRFAGSHSSLENPNQVDEKRQQENPKIDSLNTLPKDLQQQLRKRKYDFAKADEAHRAVRDYLKKVKDAENLHRAIGPLSDEDLVKLTPKEKKKVDFKGKLYLAPLTTVGNLPFRRICVEYGAEITCGEMAMCTQLLQAKPSEWALARRHPTEKIFGVQLAGAFGDTMARCAQLLSETCEVDFIDVNCGCPIDLVFQQGAGCALMNRANRLEEIIRSMSLSSTVPITVKVRAGVYGDKLTAHELIPKLATWGVDMIAVHGRTREQRYTKFADWDYIGQCASLCPDVSFYGNGDVLSYEDYYSCLESSKASGILLARGALIKPWIFTEIRERRHWDISAAERLDIVRSYAHYGLEHWGSDTQGVETTRRFLLEWLSFLYRYVPVGLLERVPIKINQRPPFYRGRDDLETLLASPNCADWIKITEMFLGKPSEGFAFLPKHKANAYQ